MNQRIDYYAHTKSQIPLMSEKLTDTVGNIVFPFSDKEEQLKFFNQMLEDLLLLASKDGCIASGCGLSTLKALLSKLD